MTNSDKLTPEEQLYLDKFQPRDYQLELYDAIENEGYRKVMAVWPRRSGKDSTCWDIAVRQALTKPCLGYYVLPTYSQARKVIWDQVNDKTGERFIDQIPRSYIKKINEADMKITLRNNSIIQLIGGDSYDTSLVGTNPFWLIFSEFSRMTPKAYQFARPILANNGGWCIINTTPFGKNHAWQLWKEAQELPEWHVSYLKTSEIHHINAEVLEEEKRGMSYELYMQEYEVSWDRGVDGAIYGRSLQALKDNGQITHVAWEPSLLVHLAIDIGVSDATTLIWYQSVGDNTLIRVIDCYSNTGMGLDHYAKIIQDKPYRMGRIFAPADIKVREWGGGAVTRYEKARQLDINFTILDQIPVDDGIENCLTHFPKMWIDENKCRSLVNALENYYREWDEIKQVYKGKPVHNWASHYCDAFRYMCMSLYRTKKQTDSKDFDRKLQEAKYGNRNLPRYFQHDPRYDR